VSPRLSKSLAIHKFASGQPEGFTAISQGLSATIPLELVVKRRHEPEGFAALVAANPAGVERSFSSLTGGVVAALLIRRLMAGIPSGCGCGGACLLNWGCEMRRMLWGIGVPAFFAAREW
jgi:hypothetical protein